MPSLTPAMGETLRRGSATPARTNTKDQDAHPQDESKDTEGAVPGVTEDAGVSGAAGGEEGQDGAAAPGAVVPTSANKTHSTSMKKITTPHREALKAAQAKRRKEEEENPEMAAERKRLATAKRKAKQLAEVPPELFRDADTLTKYGWTYRTFTENVNYYVHTKSKRRYSNMDELPPKVKASMQKGEAQQNYTMEKVDDVPREEWSHEEAGEKYQKFEKLLKFLGVKGSAATSSSSNDVGGAGMLGGGLNGGEEGAGAGAGEGVPQMDFSSLGAGMDVSAALGAAGGFAVVNTVAQDHAVDVPSTQHQGAEGLGGAEAGESAKAPGTPGACLPSAFADMAAGSVHKVRGGGAPPAAKKGPRKLKKQVTFGSPADEDEPKQAFSDVKKSSSKKRKSSSSTPVVDVEVEEINKGSSCMMEVEQVDAAGAGATTLLSPGGDGSDFMNTKNLAQIPETQEEQQDAGEQAAQGAEQAAVAATTSSGAAVPTTVTKSMKMKVASGSKQVKGTATTGAPVGGLSSSSSTPAAVVGGAEAVTSLEAGQQIIIKDDVHVNEDALEDRSAAPKNGKKAPAAPPKGPRGKGSGVGGGVINSTLQATQQEPGEHVAKRRRRIAAGTKRELSKEYDADQQKLEEEVDATTAHNEIIPPWCTLPLLLAASSSSSSSSSSANAEKPAVALLRPVADQMSQTPILFGSTRERFELKPEHLQRFALPILPEGVQFLYSSQSKELKVLSLKPGLFINGEPLAILELTTLADGDEISIHQPHTIIFIVAYNPQVGAVTEKRQKEFKSLFLSHMSEIQRAHIMDVANALRLKNGLLCDEMGLKFSSFSQIETGRAVFQPLIAKLSKNDTQVVFEGDLLELKV
ncbi:unnamed protein product [Amoebophrya sp. A25]|nr:unnamed protein product [Amoebophrya sp. A25]|eukprot:GSA25T00001296001.1